MYSILLWKLKSLLNISMFVPAHRHAEGATGCSSQQTANQVDTVGWRKRGQCKHGQTSHQGEERVSWGVSHLQYTHGMTRHHSNKIHATKTKHAQNTIASSMQHNIPFCQLIPITVNYYLIITYVKINKNLLYLYTGTAQI